MEPKVAAVAAAPTPKPFEKVEPVAKNPAQERIEARAEAAAKKAKVAAPQGPDEAEMRLVIEMDEASGSYVYKTINRLTGEVLSQLPRAEVLKLRGEVRYTAGDVIKTEA
jgi:flagellar protein FlaG